MNRARTIPWWIAVIALSGCASARAEVASEVVEAPGATGEGFLDPELAVNGVRGGGATMQSLDVYSIRPGTHLVLGWGGRALMDGPGPDLFVYENAFAYGQDGAHFMDPTVVEVSADGERWTAFEHDYVTADETVYEPQPSAWRGFAGLQPVARHAEDNPLDPFEPEAGGDAFDLADLPSEAREVRFVRLSPASDWTNPDTGMPFVRDVVSDGPDIDGVFGVVAP
ncbi:MAG: LIC_13355 family lipoprotein [Sandaracinaceae bacterium]